VSALTRKRCWWRLPQNKRIARLDERSETITADEDPFVLHDSPRESQHDKVFYEYVGHPEDFPLDSELPLDRRPRERPVTRE